MQQKPSRKKRKVSESPQMCRLPAEHFTGHGHANDSPILKNLCGSCCLPKEIAMHCQISFHCFWWSGWQWNWELKICIPRMPSLFEMSLLSWCLINVSSHVALQMGAIWCTGKSFWLRNAKLPFVSCWLAGSQFPPSNWESVLRSSPGCTYSVRAQKCTKNVSFLRPGNHLSSCSWLCPHCLAQCFAGSSCIINRCWRSEQLT